MRRRQSRAAAITLALAAGGLAAFALRPPAGTSTATLAARNPAVEVRTQVIRRTIHVIRHEPGAALRGARRRASLIVGAHGSGHAQARTRASGGHAARTGHAVSAGAVATRTSGSHGSAPAPISRPVSTRASGAHSSAPAGVSGPVSRPISTRASGSHAGASGGSSGGSSARPVSTRSSGGTHHGGEDRGGEHGGDD